MTENGTISPNLHLLASLDATADTSCIFLTEISDFDSRNRIDNFTALLQLPFSLFTHVYRTAKTYKT